LTVRLNLIACEVLYRELCAAVARSTNQIDIKFLPKALHDLGADSMRSELQKYVDETDYTRYEAILIGYALCGMGTVGLCARRIPLVVPRAHDCITLLMGSGEKYLNYFDTHKGVYFRSTGWLERGENTDQMTLERTKQKMGFGVNLEELIERFGEDNGRYVFEQLRAYQTSYRQLTFIRTGIEPDQSFEARARAEAKERGWNFDVVQGELGMIHRLVDGEWNPKEFLVVQPGEHIEARYDGSIFGAIREGPSA
jgi:hypothetical protein